MVTGKKDANPVFLHILVAGGARVSTGDLTPLGYYGREEGATHNIAAEGRSNLLCSTDLSSYTLPPALPSGSSDHSFSVVASKLACCSLSEMAPGLVP